MPKILFQDDPIALDLARALFTVKQKVSDLEMLGHACGISLSEIRNMEDRLFRNSSSPEERPVVVGDQVTSLGAHRTIGGSVCNGEVMTVEGSRIVVRWYFSANRPAIDEEIFLDRENPKYGHLASILIFEQ
jgi:hypothetical protein